MTKDACTWPYKGWALGLQGKMEEGANALNKALEIAQTGRCSGNAYFEIYNSWARHHHISNDFNQVIYWAEKAAGIEAPDAMKKAELYNLLGYNLWQTGNLSKAKNILRAKHRPVGSGRAE